MCAQNQTLRADAAAAMADRRATVANPFADILETAQKAPRPEPLRPANATDVQQFFAPKPGAAKRPRWRST